MRIHLPKLLSIMLLLACLGGCASMRPEQFAAATPRFNQQRFDPMRYFEGLTQSWGVIESRSGEPRSTFRAKMLGVRDGVGDRPDGLTITQDFTFDNGRKQQRVWHIKRIDEHRFDATGSDVIGVATGYAWGNTFRWEYTLQLKAGNPLTRVRMKHWMYLTDDGDTMINRVIISKLGIVVAETTEYFRRGEAVPAIGDAIRNASTSAAP